MAKKSAGLLMYRRRDHGLEVLLVHPGGPFWAKKDAGAWTVPKGEYLEDEEPLAAARREFEEETGFVAEGEFVPLGNVKQKSGKVVMAWAVEGDLDAALVKSNTCWIEWPPRSGVKVEVPEVDRAEWFSVKAAREKMIEAQWPFLEALVRMVDTA